MWARVWTATALIALTAFSSVAPATAAASSVVYPPKPTSLKPAGAQMTVTGRRIVDLGEELSGYIVIDVERGSVTASYSESRRDLRVGGDMGEINSLGRDDAPGRREDLFEAGSTRSRLRGGFRYVLLEGSAVIDKLGVIPGFLQPSTSNQASFYSSDPELDRIWHAGVDTLGLSTAKGPDGWVVIDGAKRDRMIWLGDLEMESLAGSYSSRDLQRAIDRTLRLFICEQWPDGYVPMALYTSSTCRGQSIGADGPVPTYDPRGLLEDGALPAYTPAFISATRNRFEFNGNRRFAWAMLPALERAASYLGSHIGEDGLFHQSGVLGWRAFDPPQEVDTYTNVSWVESLDDLAEIEDALGLPGPAAEHRAEAVQLAAAVDAHLKDPVSGLFIGGAADPTITQDANVGAVLAGMALDPAGLLARLDAVIASPFGPMTSAADSLYTQQYISPFMSGWQLIAMLRSDQGFEAKALMKQLWGLMADSDPGTMWEAMGLDGEPLSFIRGGLSRGVTSLAHGWSTAPVYALPAFAVGLRPSADGWGSWMLAPVPMGLKYAGASVPTPMGTISASWSTTAGTMTVMTHSPPGTKGEIVSPCGRIYRVAAGDVEKTIPFAC